MKEHNYNALLTWTEGVDVIIIDEGRCEVAWRSAEVDFIISGPGRGPTVIVELGWTRALTTNNINREKR